MIRKRLLLCSMWLMVCLTAFAQQVRPPQQLRIDKAYQREVKIVWNKTLLENIEWEIQVEGQQPARTTAVEYVVEGLEPDASYPVRVRMVRGEEASDFSELTVKTVPMDYKADDPQRVPYLRTLRADGTAPRILQLYYNDLASSSAQITYRYNGKEVHPEGHTLQLVPEKYADQLEVDIKEGDGRNFRLIYYINVSKD